MNLPLEKQVCSLEWAKKLKERGVPQDSVFYWNPPIIVDHDGKETYVEGAPYVLQREKYTYELADTYAAFTVAELGYFLSKTSYTNLCDAYRFLHKRDDVDKFDLIEHMTKPEYSAVMLCYLLDNGLITL